MANTYELIASNTVGGGGVYSLTFSSIPSTYTDLLVRCSARTARSAGVDTLSFTVSSGTSYSERGTYGSGSGTGSFSGSVMEMVWVSDSLNTGNVYGNGDVYIPNYASSNAKSLSGDSVSENNSTAAYQALMAGLSSSTSAISSITIASYTSNLIVGGSTFYLYGIKNS